MRLQAEPLSAHDGGMPAAAAALPLFRAEAGAAVVAEAPATLLLAPPSWRGLTIGASLAVCAAAAWLLSAGFARTETVPGRLRPAAGELRVTAGRAGIVRQVFVAEGERVARGAPLISLSTETALEGGTTSGAQPLAGLTAERDALTERQRSNREAALLRARESRALEATLRAEAASLVPQRALLVQRLQLANDYLEAARKLEASGFVRASEIKARINAKLDIEQELLENDARKAQLLGQAQQAGLAAARSLAEAEAQDSAVKEALAALRQREVDAQLQGSVLVRAAGAGRVTALRAAPGKAVDPALPLLTIIPEASQPAKPRATDGGALVADLLVPSRAAGLVASGQLVRLSIDAFPFQHFGRIEGTVAAVSQTALAPEELEVTDGTVKEPVYVVTVRLDPRSTARFGGAAMLKAGMTLSADIVLERRSVAQWLFEPLLASGRHSN